MNFLTTTDFVYIAGGAIFGCSVAACVIPYIIKKYFCKEDDFSELGEEWPNTEEQISPAQEGPVNTNETMFSVDLSDRLAAVQEEYLVPVLPTQSQIQTNAVELGIPLDLVSEAEQYPFGDIFDNKEEQSEEDKEIVLGPDITSVETGGLMSEEDMARLKECQSRKLELRTN